MQKYSIYKKLFKQSLFFGQQQLSFQIAFWTSFTDPIKLKEL